MDVDGIRAYAQYCVDRIGEKRGSIAEIARKCGISDSIFSPWLKGNYAGNDENVAADVAKGLYYWDSRGVVVRTVSSYLQVADLFDVAKSKSKWVCISSRSGSGKTQSLIDLYNTSEDNSVVYLRCRKWGARKFLTKLATSLSVAVKPHYDCDRLLDEIRDRIDGLSAKHPVLILDDAGKLSNSAMQLFIPLYDDTLGRMGCVVAGTETLERTIKRNVGRVEGYDEIDSRFKRYYQTLLGATKRDVLAICKASGVMDAQEASFIWGKLSKFQKEVVDPKNPEETIKDWFADDLRELSGMIDDALVRQEFEHGGVVR